MECVTVQWQSGDSAAAADGNLVECELTFPTTMFTQTHCGLWQVIAKPHEKQTQKKFSHHEVCQEGSLFFYTTV